jgi:hypothetical protein
MNFWPESSTLSEDSAATPAAANSGAKNQQASVFSAGAGVPAVNAGEIMLSKAETAALAALETEPDEKHGLRRARQESGLTDQQISMLQRRAKHALSKGITLKGVGFVRKPTGGAPEEPSLLRKAQKEDKTALEALREQRTRSEYSLPAHSDFRFPVPHSEGRADDIDSVHLMNHGAQLPRKAKPGSVEEAEEANAISTMGKLTSAARRQRLRRS